MATSPLLLLAWPIFFLTLLLIGWKFSTGITDVVTLFTLVFGLFYGFRSLILVLGLDTPYPDRFFDPSQAGNTAAATLLWLTEFLLCFGAGVYTMANVIRPRGVLFFAPRPPSIPRLLTATAGLTVVACLISAFMITHYGGVGAFIHAVKVQKALVGLYFLKVPASIGAVVAFATFLEIRQRPGSAHPLVTAAVFICGLLDGFSVFLWGQRSTLVVLGVILMLGGRRRGVHASGGAAMTVIRLALSVVIVVAVSVGLRFERDTLVGGGSHNAVAQANVFRTISIGTNSIYFDSSMLAFRDWPSQYQYRNGVDFRNGAAGLVPRKLWPGKPANVTIGREFRQFYQPEVVNGWPVGAPTLWWLDFGPLGVIFGGLISGLGFGWIRSAQRNSAQGGLNVATAIVTAVYVFQLGIGSEWPVYFTIWTAPLWVVSAFASRGLGSTVTDSAPSAASVRSSPSTSFWT